MAFVSKTKLRVEASNLTQKIDYLPQILEKRKMGIAKFHFSENFISYHEIVLSEVGF